MVTLRAIPEMKAPHGRGALSDSCPPVAHGRLQLGFGFDAASVATSLSASILADLAKYGASYCHTIMKHAYGTSAFPYVRT